MYGWGVSFLGREHFPVSLSFLAQENWRIPRRASIPVMRMPNDLTGRPLLQKTAWHAGDLGDVLFSLPTLRALGIQNLVLSPAPYTNVTMTPAHAELILPLLREQPYIQSATHSDTPPAYATSLNRFREVVFELKNSRNLAEMHAIPHGVAIEKTPWISVKRPKKTDKVVFSRTFRHEVPGFPWKEALSRWGKGAVFLGTEAEHRAFSADIGPIQWVKTPNFKVAAEIIAGSQLFVGNQGGLHAIAEAMWHPAILAAYRPLPTPVIRRPFVTHHFGEGEELVAPINI